MKKQSIVKMEQSALRTQAVIAVVFGIVAVAWPGLTAVVLVRLFAIFLSVDAVILLVSGLNNWQYRNKASLHVILGLVELCFGLILFHRPDIGLATIIVLLGIVLIVRGCFNVLHALVLHASGMSKSLHLLLALLGIIIGVVILREPVAGGVAFVWVLGLYALASGPLLFAISNNLDQPKR